MLFKYLIYLAENKLKLIREEFSKVATPHDDLWKEEEVHIEENQSHQNTNRSAQNHDENQVNPIFVERLK